MSTFKKKSQAKIGLLKHAMYLKIKAKSVWLEEGVKEF